MSVLSEVDLEEKEYNVWCNNISSQTIDYLIHNVSGCKFIGPVFPRFLSCSELRGYGEVGRRILLSGIDLLGSQERLFQFGWDVTNRSASCPLGE